MARFTSLEGLKCHGAPDDPVGGTGPGLRWGGGGWFSEGWGGRLRVGAGLGGTQRGAEARSCPQRREDGTGGRREGDERGKTGEGERKRQKENERRR